MQFNAIILQVSKDFIHAFNQRDFDNLSHFLTLHFYIQSDNIQKIYPNKVDNKIVGIEEAIEYWKELVVLNPTFKFDESFQVISNKGKNIQYSGLLTNGKPYQAKFIINEYAKFECLILEYPESI
ncbi:MAG: hypothetical protein IPL09_13095 [Bacteroidetes bacterium]|jgi:hypothetical protein|nr:hypothetical protein [Bacteroidota bacterium]MBK7040168.1 hypothetical protein [Bacteroidota bacterium]MBK7586971.1 hypothetical protein [Bacteroidota bacterium]MBK8330367.1 hypothetical protein [Bacteroidota bacterium]MBK9299983.1 hypothetical protein [Bacteroidota bacterium]